MYGYVLSSRRTTLNFGRYCLMRLCSSAKASRSLPTRMVSRSAISRASDPVLASAQRDSRKYERTRLRRERALRSEEHTSELQSRLHLVCRLLLEKKKKKKQQNNNLKKKKKNKY